MKSSISFLTTVASLLSVASATTPSCEGPEIAVLGHKSPDTDAIASAIIYAWELRNPTFRSIASVVQCAVPYINTHEPNKETLFVLEYFGVDIPEIMDSVNNETIFATVDTNNIDEMPNGAAEHVADNLHSIVDHHKLTGLVTTKPLIVDVRNLGSAGSVLYHRSIEAGRSIPGIHNTATEIEDDGSLNIAGLMLATILSDTLNLLSPTTTQLDIDAVSYLAPLAGVDNTDDFFFHMIAAKSDISGDIALDLMMLDSNVYSFEDGTGAAFKLRVSVLESGVPKDPLALATNNELQDACEVQLTLDQAQDDSVRDVLFFVIDILNKTAIYVPCSGNSHDYALKLVTGGNFPDMLGKPVEHNCGTIFLDGVV